MNIPFAPIGSTLGQGLGPVFTPFVPAPVAKGWW